MRGYTSFKRYKSFSYTCFCIYSDPFYVFMCLFGPESSFPTTATSFPKIVYLHHIYFYPLLNHLSPSYYWRGHCLLWCIIINQHHYQSDTLYQIEIYFTVFYWPEVCYLPEVHSWCYVLYGFRQKPGDICIYIYNHNIISVLLLP